MFKVVLTGLALSACVAACGKRDEVIRLGSNSYFFPAKHISAIVKPEESGSGQYFVRLIPPGGYYWLVHAPWKESRPNRQGPGVPTIANINDYRTEIVVRQSEVGPIVCKQKPIGDDSAFLREIFTCGFRIYDNGVVWSVIIPGDLIASAPALKRRAELSLADYRRDARAKAAK
jgi:hypothetical protein